MSDLVSQFKNLYERWEQYLKMRYGRSDMHKNTKRFWKEEGPKCKTLGVTENDLLGLLNLRNINAHSPSFVEIKPKALTTLKRIVNGFCKTATEIATPEHKVYKADLDSNVKDVVQVMARNLYTHVPIVGGGRFIGIFSENTFLKLVSQNVYTENIKIKDIKNFLKNTKGTDDYKFLPPDSEFWEVHKLFQDYIDKGKRLGVIFLTKDGKRSGEIKGLITAWDLHRGTK